MNGWFLVFIISQVLGVGISLANHGKPINGKYNFWATSIASLILIWIVYNAIQVGI